MCFETGRECEHEIRLRNYQDGCRHDSQSDAGLDRVQESELGKRVRVETDVLDDTDPGWAIVPSDPPSLHPRQI
jgi:hypothetical protein